LMHSGVARAQEARASIGAKRRARFDQQADSRHALACWFGVVGRQAGRLGQCCRFYTRMHSKENAQLSDRWHLDKEEGEGRNTHRLPHVYVMSLLLSNIPGHHMKQHPCQAASQKYIRTKQGDLES